MKKKCERMEKQRKQFCQWRVHWRRQALDALVFVPERVSGVCMAADNRHLYGFPLGALERKAEKKNRTGKGENNADCRP